MSGADENEERARAPWPGRAYAYASSGKAMLIAIPLLFAFAVFMVGLHLYLRRHFDRQRLPQLERRPGPGPGHVMLYAGDDRGGLEAAVVGSLPVFVYHADRELAAECAVCLLEFEEEEVVRLLPNCDHCFHIECLDMWFRSHSTCPLCRLPAEKVAAGRAAEPGSSKPCGASESYLESGIAAEETTP